MPRISRLYFMTAIAFLLAGILIGLQMAISGDHSVMGAHAHINLLGWVTSALFGVYYALNKEKAGRLAFVQFGVYTAGVLVMTPALYLLLRGNPAMEPIVATGSLIAFAGVALFAFIVFTDVRSKSPAVGFPASG